jgi:4-hydroxybenzoate polyprenyltransferase
VKLLYHIGVSIRPGQWTKNLVVFAALIFSRSFEDPTLVLRSVEAFLIFCLLSGVIYLANDIADVEKDRLHERKRHRPLPAGKLSRPRAAAAAVLIAAVAVAWATRVGSEFTIVACAFLVLNLLYSFVLKRVVLLDAMSISVSFILRAIGGVEALVPIDPDIQISPWLLICTLFLSLFLAFCKRRHELLSLEGEIAANHRESLSEYSPALLDQLVGLTASGSVLSYSIYAIWPDTVAKFGTHSLVYTVPLVVLGVMRYLHLVYTREKGGNPSELLLHERFLLTVVLAWIALVVVILGDFL